MHNLILVAKNEMITKLTQRSFWVLTFILPMLLFGMNFGLQLLSINMMNQTLQEDIASLTQEGEGGPQIIGFVDQAGILNKMPPDIESTTLQAFSDETSAREALSAQKIAYYYLIPKDFIETGDLTVVENSFRPLRHMNPDSLFRYVLTYNLSGDATLARLLPNPLEVTHKASLSPAATTHGANNPLTYLVPFLTMFIFFYVLTTSSSLMLGSVYKEKSSHLMEIILLSIHPRELIAGKIVGLSVVAMIQMAIWSTGSILITGSGALIRIGSMLSQEDVLSSAITQPIEALSGATTNSALLTLPPGFFIWGLLYLLLGYLLYATTLGAIGALLPDGGESGILTLITYLPLFASMMLSFEIIRTPHSGLATFLSLFPLTSPISMMTRIAASHVAVAQILLSLSLLGMTTYGMVAFAARALKPERLLSEAKLNWKGLLKRRKSP